MAGMEEEKCRLLTRATNGRRDKIEILCGRKKTRSGSSRDAHTDSAFSSFCLKFEKCVLLFVGRPAHNLFVPLSLFSPPPSRHLLPYLAMHNLGCPSSIDFGVQLSE